MAELTTAQLKLIDEIARKNGFCDFEIDVRRCSVKGDNFMSVPKLVTIEERKCGKALQLFVKCALTSVQLRELIPIHEIFRREIVCYNDIFPRFKEIHQAKNAQYEFPRFAEFCGGVLEDFSEAVVLENLVSNGFRLVDKKNPFDEAHIEAVFREYGKIHAFSFAISDQMPHEFDSIKQQFDNLFKKMVKQEGNRKANEKRFDEVAEFLDDPKLVKRLINSRDEMVEVMEDMDRGQAVLVHGDCWCNNIFFRYEDKQHPNIPTKVCFIDWQATKVTTPVSDLSFFFCASAPKEILYDYERYLKIYYESMSRMLKELGSDPSKVFPYSELQKHWKNYCKFGLYVGMIIIKVMLSESSEVPDLSKAAESGKKFMEALEFESSNNETFKKRIKDLVEFMVDKEFI